MRRIFGIRRFLAVMLCLCMVGLLVPAVVNADDTVVEITKTYNVHSE